MPSGKHRRASWVSSVREFIFSPLPSLLSSSGGVELTKSKNTFRKIDISAFRFSLATFSQVRIISPRFLEEEEERRTNNMRYTIMHEQLNLHILYVGKTTGERHRGSSITRLRQSTQKTKNFISGTVKKTKPTTPVGKSSITRYCTPQRRKNKKASWKV